jgi:hypothetical protein
MLCAHDWRRNVGADVSNDYLMAYTKDPFHADWNDPPLVNYYDGKSTESDWHLLYMAACFAAVV